ncbi:MAG TPA: hypothetical protein GX691_03425, partial [Clostridia bacterium]|nr:hypothetical protein [Clostridia bacterium]
MSLFKKVLFPVTLSLDLEQILDNALFLKRLNIQSFDLINVVSSGFGNKDDSLEALHQAVGIIRQKIPYNVSAEVVEGHAASEIVNMARGQDYNLIFIPGHDKNIMN